MPTKRHCEGAIGTGHALRARPQFVAWGVTDLPAALRMLARKRCASLSQS
jgi:hypothetical protein